MKKRKVFCHKHPETALVCPKCAASKGGKVTAKKYSAEQMREWGKRGGRPRKPVVVDGVLVDGAHRVAAQEKP
jgi:hypothetical protein